MCGFNENGKTQITKRALPKRGKNFLFYEFSVTGTLIDKLLERFSDACAIFKSGTREHFRVLEWSILFRSRGRTWSGWEKCGDCSLLGNFSSKHHHLLSFRRIRRQLTQPLIMPLHHIGRGRLVFSVSVSDFVFCLVKFWLLRGCSCISFHRSS